jgi:hypothetical protein
MTHVHIPECLEPGARVVVTETTADGRPAILVAANREGLVTLARLLLFMTQPNAKPGIALDVGVCGALDPASTRTLLIKKDA